MIPFLLAMGLIAFILSRRYAWWRASVDYRHPRILMYHMVCEAQPGAKFNKLRVPPANFEQQLAWLKEQGWHFASMSDLGNAVKLPSKTVILTFDDGYEDNLLNADPVLERYDAKATIYVVEDRFNRDWSTSKKAHHDSGELMRESKLSDVQLEQMLASGRWELGGHTRTHANLANLNSAQRNIEISDARQSLAARFSVPVDSFAYPFGIYGPEDVAAARSAGFTTAVTTREGISLDVATQAMELPRIKVSGKDSMLAFRLRMRTGLRGA
ncbi:polysaccharide deacetylase family protein [Congregibacter variabilis]|uniref:Polysaccharide deacetylase family protein n=1 Tax=Congregibacter variabilis TaxID=3081200 RepID=A0ABZ0I248_9GAMM|nr:polysaccharide deacetylase family protein [Congregibacter sp. IMCC43200]